MVWSGAFSLLWFSCPSLWDILTQQGAKRPESILPQRSLGSGFPERASLGLYESEARGTWPAFQDDCKNLYFYAPSLCHSLLFPDFSGAVQALDCLLLKNTLETRRPHCVTRQMLSQLIWSYKTFSASFCISVL